VIDPIVAHVQAQRAASGQTTPPTFNTSWPRARSFYEEAWRRGLDVKLGLAAIVMQVLCMAPSSAIGVVLIFLALRRVFRSDRTAMWLALLYAFGTPVFFRTGFLNHNLMLGHIAFAGFLALWNPAGSARWSLRARYLVAGLAGGVALLFDYSGVIFLLGLFAYGVWKRYRDAGAGDAVRHGSWYVAGTLAPVALLWFYQYRAFGNAFLPGQHWMPPVRWIERGYQGFSGPQLEIFSALAIDLRYGLFVAAPVMLLALAAPFVNQGVRRVLPQREMVVLLSLFVALWLFFSGNNYTRLQFNTGIRYMTPIFPFLFIPAAVVLMRLRPAAIYAVALVALVVSWPLAMYREVEKPLGILDPIVRTVTAGFQLPALSSLGQTTGQYGDFFANGVSPLPLFCLTGALIYALWSPRFRRAPHAAHVLPHRQEAR
jgi:hypothetical protein